MMKDLTKLAAPTVIKRNEVVNVDRITYDDHFLFRASGIDEAHKADLTSTIRNTGLALDPVILWQPENMRERAQLVLLDGAHRVAAYRAAGWAQPIPAIIVTCDRRTALRAALAGNSRRSLQLTQAERMDAAWRLVREPVEPRYKVREIVAAADVSQRTVKYMRDRFRTMHEEGIEITGQWSRDRTNAEWSDDPPSLSEAQRKAEIGKLVADIRDLIDRRKHPDRTILRDGQAVDEAVLEALGDVRIKAMFNYFFGEVEDATDWLGFASNACGPYGEETEEEFEPKF